MKSYEKRIWASVYNLVEQKGSNIAAFMDAVVELIVQETKRSYIRGLSAGRGKREDTGEWKAGEYRSALKNGKLKPKQ